MKIAAVSLSPELALTQYKNASSNEPAQIINLPALTVQLEKHKIGRIFQIIEEAKQVRVVDKRETEISARKKIQVLILEDGQSIVISDRKIAKLPPTIDGVLCISGKAPKWLSHRKQDQLRQEYLDDSRAVKQAIHTSWDNSFNYRVERYDRNGAMLSTGLRPPQIGGLYAMGAHWSIENQPATVVMPTGTGKTETMIAATIAFSRGTVLVVVPWIPLREQTVRKFSTLGLLRQLKTLAPTVRNPIVGVIEKRPTKVEDVSIFDKCNIVIAAMPSLAQKIKPSVMAAIIKHVDVLFIDEAHHVPSNTWSAFKAHFKTKRIMQFTATPFRRDGKLVDGRVIFSYSLSKAQADGYFKKINFKPIFEIDSDLADQTIATSAVEHLKNDLLVGRNHILMARCSSISRAEKVLNIYQSLCPDLNPLLIHSKSNSVQSSIEALRTGQSKVVVCVDMLGEGFDLAQLKVAALHDVHKSVGVILQFAGRFTRTAGVEVGEATVIANIADQRLSDALERLYSEDADWNEVLSEFSSEAARTHAEFIEFLDKSIHFTHLDENDDEHISPQLLRPKFSCVVYQATKFEPKKFFHGLAPHTIVRQVWFHEQSNTLYFVAQYEEPTQWSRSRQLRDRQLHLFVVHFDAEKNLLYINASDKSSTHNGLAIAISGDDSKLIAGDQIFKSLGRINRLLFQNIGVKKHGRRNLRYAMYTGADVKDALSIAEKAGSVKSNLYGWGYENGRLVTIGCSYKGRIWARENDVIPRLIEWFSQIGAKLLDSQIDTTQIIDNVLIPEEVLTLPPTNAFGVDWPMELWHQSEDRITLKAGAKEYSFCTTNIEFEGIERNENFVQFAINCGDNRSSYRLKLDTALGFVVTHVAGPALQINVGRISVRLEMFFSDYPPIVRFVDLSELDGNLLIRPKDTRELSIPIEQFEVWDWSGIDITLESMWKGEVKRESSIQEHVSASYVQAGYEIVYDDDSPGEAADLICIREEGDEIQLSMIHCKFSGHEEPGERIKDISEVSNQAVRSSKWAWRFRELAQHIIDREKKLKNKTRASRFIKGDASILNRFVKQSRFKRIVAEIIIVQPGLSKQNRSAEQTIVLAAAHSFIKETIGVDLAIICSS